MLPANNHSDYGHLSAREFNELFTQFQDTMRWYDFIFYKPVEPSILSACEDPNTVLEYIEESTLRKFPIAQTEQMGFEFELLQSIKDNLFIAGLYGISVSTRDEVQRRIKSRLMHKRFPMFEFEFKGDFNMLIAIFTELLENSGVKSEHIVTVEYSEALRLLKKPETALLTDEDEVWINQNIAPCVLLTKFPEASNPFFNMKRIDGIAQKCDIIFGGMECAGGAERETEKEPQQEAFYRLPLFAETLFSKFGKNRVLNELDYYFSLLTPLAVRSGAGFGLSRYAAALENYKKHVK